MELLVKRWLAWRTADVVSHRRRGLSQGDLYHGDLMINIIINI